jgi:hypothetical protein
MILCFVQRTKEPIAISVIAIVCFTSPGNLTHLTRNSERIPRSWLRGERANDRSIKIPYGEDSLQFAAGNLQKM